MTPADKFIAWVGERRGNNNRKAVGRENDEELKKRNRFQVSMGEEGF